MRTGYAPPMRTCPTCRGELPDAARFCHHCGTRLAASAGPIQERKVITALFCDLVGFTATSEGADPEDVDRMLTRYFAMARGHIEAYGGVVEKFIGDAVVGVFGVPAAHEDDPERAVRAALRICEDAVDLPALEGAPLRLRIGINTGEALVRFDVVPGAGERFLAGDTINTASRIQSVAPEMGVAVGAATFAATRDRFDYEPLPPAAVKGKREPVAVHRPIAPRSRLGTDVTRRAAGVLVGRRAELGSLTRAFEAMLETGRPQAALIVGEPGLGKSRLLTELLSHVDATDTLVTWRQGRCLPYGNGIPFWALGEIVKAHAGILETDAAAVAHEKLDRLLPDGPERAWMRDRLLPLLGVDAGPTAGREERFSAWRRFLAIVANARPTIVVFEDLHWADAALLEFLDTLVGKHEPLPLFVVGTTRPQLLEDRPGALPDGDWRHIRLAPLDADDTRRLLSSALGATAVGPDIEGPILERAAGNPLYVEEYVRLLRDRSLLEATPDGRFVLRAGSDLPLPDTIQALLASRLDALPADEKALLADASVIGKVFWAGALAAMADGDRDRVADRLAHLAALEFIRPARQSSMADDAEYSFWHVLVRDVAYGTLPRTARIQRHLAAARWIEDRAADRLDDIADVLAHHYVTALDLAVAAGDDDAAGIAEPQARRFLTVAGERASGLDVPRALDLLERAMAMTPPDHPDRAALLVLYGRALLNVGRYPEAASRFEEAIERSRQDGSALVTAVALGGYASASSSMGDPRADALSKEMLSLLEPLGPTPELAEAQARVAALQVIDGRWADGVAGLRGAIATAGAATFARDVDRTAFLGQVLGFVGFGQASMGEAEGLGSLREGISILAAAGRGGTAGLQYYNYLLMILQFDGPSSARSVLAEAREFATARGLGGAITGLDELDLLIRHDLGQHDAVSDAAADVDARLEQLGLLPERLDLGLITTRIALLRGGRGGSAGIRWMDQAARQLGTIEALTYGFTAAIAAHVGDGRHAAARALLGELGRHPKFARTWLHAHVLSTLVRIAVALGDLALARSMAAAEGSPTPRNALARASASAAVLEAGGERAEAADAYAAAAAGWERFGVPEEQAFALLGQGRSLLAIGRMAAGVAALERSRSLFEPLRAAPSLREIDALTASIGEAHDPSAREIESEPTAGPVAGPSGVD